MQWRGALVLLRLKCSLRGLRAKVQPLSRKLSSRYSVPTNEFYILEQVAVRNIYANILQWKISVRLSSLTYKASSDFFVTGPLTLEEIAFIDEAGAKGPLE